MSDCRLWLDAAQAAAGARELGAAGRQLGAQRRRAGADLEAASAARPWGGDDVGRTFDRHYRPVERQVLDAWEQLAAYVSSLSDAAAGSVRDNLRADAAAGRRVRSAYGAHP